MFTFLLCFRYHHHQQWRRWDKRNARSLQDAWCTMLTTTPTTWRLWPLDTLDWLLNVKRASLFLSIYDILLQPHMIETRIRNDRNDWKTLVLLGSDLIHDWVSCVGAAEMTSTYSCVIDWSYDNNRSFINTFRWQANNAWKNIFIYKMYNPAIFQCESQCLKITQNVPYRFLNFGIFHHFLFY